MYMTQAAISIRVSSNKATVQQANLDFQISYGKTCTPLLYLSIYIILLPYLYFIWVLFKMKT